MTTHTSFACDRCGKQLRGLPAIGHAHGYDRLGFDRIPDDWSELRFFGNESFMSEPVTRHYCKLCGPLLAVALDKFDNPKLEPI